MPKSSKLTKKQNELILENYDQIKKNIRKFLRKHNHLIKYNLLYEILSYVPDVTLEYDDDKGKRFKFANWAASWSIRRWLDYLRKQDPNFIKSRRNKVLIRKVKRALVKTKQVVNSENIENYLKNLGFDPKEIIDNTIYIREDHNCELEKIIVEDDHTEIEWADFRQNIIEKAEKHFKEVNEDWATGRNKNCHIYKKLLQEYIIPLCNKQLTKDKPNTLSKLAKDLLVKESRLSQMIKDDHMRGFINTLDLDILYKSEYIEREYEKI